MRYLPNALDRCHSILQLRELARRRLPRSIFDYLDGAAETEVTARRNTNAFDCDQLIPKCLVNVSSVNTATEILGQRIEWPVFCSPTGASRLYHPEGELAVARAAAHAATYYSLSVASTHTLEAVAAASQGPKMFQILLFKDRALTRELIERCKAAGYRALCLTVDAALRGKRERELSSGMGIPLNLSLASRVRFALRPAWFVGTVRTGPLTMANLEPRSGRQGLAAVSQYLGQQLDASVSWTDVAELIRQWNGPFAIKGILSVDDARRAHGIGATAIIVSNHGGRQLDGAAAPIDVLPEIAAAVGDRVEVILDGGIRRGVHVLKALAHGARACSIGRPYLFGLAAAGEAGVTKALGILRAELVLAMQLCGCPDVRTIDASLVRRMWPPAAG
ncbi:MAG TPA: alpha-hydroxy acid oxidase [Steroidobacteraceae bacterium]|nr:alpha-hydroxy acid oxidase [Steroidobacteraceae bacterium]